MDAIHTGRLIALAAILTYAQPLMAVNFETPPIFKASKILPPKLLRSEVHHVVEAVPNDGYMNHFTIVSDYGDFTAQGLSQLKIRVQEVKALDELSRVKKTSLYIEAAAQSILSPVVAVGNFVARPVDTIKALPGGVDRMLRGFGRLAKSVTKPSHSKKSEAGELETQAEKYAKQYMGVGRAQRKWAKKLSVDPYTRNQKLQTRLTEVATVDATASFGAKLLMPGLGAVSLVAHASKLAWNISAAELRARNLKVLQQEGASKQQIENFLNNRMFDPTMQTVIVTGLLELSGVQNRMIVLDQASKVESENMAYFFMDMLRMLVGFERSEGNLAALESDAGIFFGKTVDKRAVYVLPLDYLAWTKQVAATFGQQDNVADKQIHREFWLEGEASPLAVQVLKVRGWTVHQDVKLL